MIATLIAAIVATATTALWLRERHRRQRAGAALRRYRDLGEIASEWSWESDASRRLTFLSDRFTIVTGIPVATLIGRSIAELEEFNLDADAVSDLDHAVEARLPFVGHVHRVALPDGRIRFWRASGKPLFDERTGAFLGYFGTAGDVTDAVAREDTITVALRRAGAAEEAASLARVRLLDAIDVVPVGFALWDADDRLVLCNARYRELYHKLADLMTPGTGFEEMVRAGAERGQYQLGGRDPEGWVRERMDRHRAGARLEQRLADGRFIQIDERRTVDRGTVGIHVDVSEARQREAAERGHEKLAALGQLAGGVAHEINNLLQPALSFPALISERLAPDDLDSREDLATILDSARKARDIVRNILLFARKEEPTLIAFNLAAEVQAAVNFVRSLMPPMVTIGMQPAGDDAGGRVSGNKTQLTQVLTNLMVNAAQAMRDRGTITIATARRHVSRGEAIKLGVEPGRAYLTAAVTDTGCGMDAATQAHIFEPFFTTKPVGQGTGLGLSVVHAILQSWGGTIAVKSAPDRGTTFTLYLPELPAAEAGAEALPAMPPPVQAAAAASPPPG